MYVWVWLICFDSDFVLLYCLIAFYLDWVWYGTFCTCVLDYVCLCTCLEFWGVLFCVLLGGLYLCLDL